MYDAINATIIQLVTIEAVHISMKSMTIRSKRSVKRSKTFTGCWTCRSRSVKCGQEKPACQRCRQSGLECAGYSVSLVWPNENEPKQIRRRVLLDPLFSSHLAFSDQAVNSALESIDSVLDGLSLTVGLFSVFPGTTPSGHLTDGIEGGHGDTAYGFQHHGDKTPREETSTTNMDSKLYPYGYCPPIIRSKDERQLMYHWITCLSKLLTPTPRLDNAFQDIHTPMALSAITTKSHSSGHLALLHSLYAVSAFSRASIDSIQPTRRSELSLGAMHVQKTLQHLKKSLTTTDFEEQQAILATITTLAVVPCFTGGSSDWRIHIRGGSGLLQSIDRSAWKRSPNAVALYQLFVGLEALRPAHSAVAKDLEPLRLSLVNLGLPSNTWDTNSEDQLSDDQSDRYLESIWGVTKPLMGIIAHINQLVFSDKTLSEEELGYLELKILRSDPSVLRFPSPNKHCEDMTLHHACAFYYACHIYFLRSVRKLPPQIIQHLVRQCIEQIETTESLEVELNFSGVFWPMFIAACEAEDTELRLRAMQYIGRRWMSLGLPHVTDAKKVVLGVWSRRDQVGKHRRGTIFWYDIMAELGVDILLT